MEIKLNCQYLVCIHHQLDETWGLEEAQLPQVGGG